MLTITDEIKKHYDAFWAGDAFDRCCLYLAKYPVSGEGAPVCRDLTQQWEDSEYRLQQYNFERERTEFFADGFPSFVTNFGPGSLTAVIGGTYKWSENTVWFENEQVITDWKNPPIPTLHKNSNMYRLTQTLTETMLNAGSDKFITSVADIGGTYDIVAALRGTQELLMDLYEYPKEIKSYVQKLQVVWMSYFNELARYLISRQGGMTSWMHIWSDKPYYPLQCDFSAMISPDMFEEFILPDLKYQTDNMPRSVYHLDGPGEIPHLKHLLTLPNLSAIQWTSGAGQEVIGHERWFEMYEEIQSAGKGLVLLGIAPEELENLLKRISSKGLFVHTAVQNSAEASECIRIAESYGVK